MAPNKEEKVLDSFTLYTVGWIAALKHERAAALVMLDERHGKPRGFVKHRSDDNVYTWGRIGDHNIVVVSLPAGEYGLASAASTVQGMRFSLPHIRIGLFVGIGGGVPAKDDILLGDVVVSEPNGTNGGVVQYDLYKATGENRRERKGFLNSPPRALLNALTALQADHEMSEPEISQYLKVIEGNDRMRVPYGFPGIDLDPVRQTQGNSRESPTIHYGIIASGNTLVKSSSHRDELIEWLREENINPLCFEMEAAGLMNSFPCLVVRGICDYADEHKNDVWQRYAAATAAAYTKELLGYIDVDEVEQTTKIEQVMDAVQGLHIAVKDGFSGMMSHITDNRERSQLQTRLDTAKSASYNARFQEHATTCLEGTRIDLLEQISDWAGDIEGRCIFWLCGKAGMGKSTIARTVAQMLDHSHQLGASFFFKRGEDDRKDATKFFSTIVMQLAEKVTLLRKGVVEALDADSALCHKSLKHQFEEMLFKPIAASMQQHTLPQDILAIVVDALDECEDEQDVRTILSLLGRLGTLKPLRFRIFLTSRPELPVKLGFHDLDSRLHQDIKLEIVQVGTINNDIRTYFEYQFAAIRTKQSLRSFDSLAADWPGDQQIAALVQLAVPLFIFAFTICRYISERNPRQRLQTILDQNKLFAFSELGKTYIPVLQQIILDRDVCEQDQAIIDFKSVVGPIVLLVDPLSAESLSSLLDIPINEIAETLSQLHSVLDIPESRHDEIRLLHLSFRDFLVAAPDEAAQQFCIDEVQTHREVAEHCLRRLEQPQILKQDLCGLVRPGTRRVMVDRQRITSCIPPDVAYACSHWVSHFLQGQQKLCDEDRTHRWLKRHFLHWLEALSWLGRLSSAIVFITELKSRVKIGKATEVSAFLEDARRFLLTHRYVINLAPLQLYHSVLIFTPVHSIVRKNFSHETSDAFTLLPNVRMSWNAEIQKLEGHDGIVWTVAFSPDGKLLASASGQYNVRLWDVTTGEERQKLEGHDRTVSAVAFSPDGKLLASASEDKTILLWDVTTGEQRQKLKGHKLGVSAVAFSPNGELLVSASADDTLRLWGVTTGEQMQKLEGHNGGVTAVAFSPDGSLLASASMDDTVRLWDVTTGEERQKLEGHDNVVTAVAFSPDGSLLASASLDDTIQLWDVRTSQGRQKLEGHNDSIYAIDFSPDGELLASASADDTIRLWDTRSGEERQKLEGHDRTVFTVAFSPDGKTLGSGSEDETLRLWNMVTNEENQKLEGHHGDIWGLAFSPDGQLVASTSEDMTIRLWDATTGEQTQKIDIGKYVRELGFSSDGKSLRTDVGDFEVAYSGTAGIERPRLPIALEQRGEWLRCWGEDVLWLPHEYRRSCSVAFENTLAIGQYSGTVSFFTARSR